MDTLLHILQVLAFWALALALLAWPLWPAWREWRHPTDLNPLPVVRHHSGDARSFAQHFGRWMHEQAEGPLRAATDAGANGQVLPFGRQRFRLLGAPAIWLNEQAGLVIDDGLVSLLSMYLPERTVCRWEVGSHGNLTLGPQVRVRAAVSGGDLQIGRSAQIQRWADAQGQAQAQDSAVIEGRLTSARAIHLGHGVRFSRLSAPRISVGTTVVPIVVPHLPQAWQPDQGEAMDASGETWRYPAALRLPAGAVVSHKLVVDGDLHIGAGARIEGDVKVQGTLTTDEGVVFLGAVVATEVARLGPHACAAGPVVGEDQVQLGLGVKVGSADQVTTVTGNHVALAQGVLVHGSVWARSGGWTETP